jgi:putative membrane protein
MIRTIVFSLSLVMAAAVAVIPAAVAQGAKPEPRPYTQVTLALLVDGRAANNRVKQFGEEMIVTHKRMSQEVQAMAAEKGVQLPVELRDEHKQKLKELSQLSGHAFDREYMRHILWHHQHDVQEFEESMRTVEEPDVLHWSYRTLPMLRAHVEEARWIQQSMQTNP